MLVDMASWDFWAGITVGVIGSVLVIGAASIARGRSDPDAINYGALYTLDCSGGDTFEDLGRELKDEMARRAARRGVGT
jgi:hypothetical protein